VSLEDRGNPTEWAVLFLLPRSRLYLFPAELDFLLDDVNAIACILVNGRTMEMLHGPTCSMQNMVSFPVALANVFFMECSPIRLDGNFDIGKCKIHEVSSDAELRLWRQALLAHTLVQLEFYRRHPNLPVRSIYLG
jgi:hypothetical protein